MSSSTASNGLSSCFSGGKFFSGIPLGDSVAFRAMLNLYSSAGTTIVWALHNL